MQITVDTDNPKDLQILEALATVLGAATANRTAKKAAAAAPETVQEAVAADAVPPTPAKKAAAPKVAVAEPAPEPETEDSAEATQADAVKLATDLVAAGHATVVKFALRQLGVERVSKLADEDIAKFVTALTTDFDETKDASEQEG